MGRVLLRPFRRLDCRGAEPLGAGVAVGHAFGGKLGQRLKAPVTLSAACLASPAAFPARPFVFSRRFPVTRPALSLTLPLAVWALCLIFLRMLTVLPLPGDSCLPQLGNKWMTTGQCLRRNMTASTMITITTIVPSR